MAGWNRKNTIFIMAPTGYARKSIEEKGISVFSPYHGDDGILRVLRELCFRIPVLPKSIWYNKEVLDEKYVFLNVIDVNVTTHYLKWIRKHFPDSQINFIYDNMVGKARNISPEKVPDGIRVWTYDDHDARKYNIRLQRNYWVREMLFKQRQKSEFDVFFVGRDKRRGEKLLDLERQFLSMGLKTKFIITKDGKMSRRKIYYQQSISYEQVIDYDTRSRAILNIAMENQEGVTMRDIESVAIGVKLITTNSNIVNKDLYNRNNVFILGIDDLKTLPAFLESEYVNVWEGIKEKHTFETMMDEITVGD